MSDRTAATAGFLVAGVALLGALAVEFDGPTTAPLLATLAAALVAFGLRRHGRLDRRIGAPIAGTTGVALVAIALATGGETAGTPALALAGIAVATLAAADWYRIDDERLGEMGFATVLAAILGVAGLLSVAVWSGALGAVLGTGTIGRRYLVGTLAIGPATAAVAGLYLLGAGRGVDYLDLHAPTRRDAAIAVVGAATLLALNVVATVVLRELGIEAASHDLVVAARSDPGLLLALVPLAYLSVGLGEELLYRSVIQGSLYDTFSRRGAVVVASVVFAGAHFYAFAGRGDSLDAVVVSLALVFALSLVLGILYERTENVLVPAFAHGTFDAAVYLILYVEIVGLPA